MTEAQHREFLVDAGLAWRVVVAQQLRTFLASPLIALGLVTAFFGYLSVWGSSGFLWPLWWLFVVLAAFYALLLGATMLVSWLILRARLPVGSRFTAVQHERTLAFSGPLGEADVDYGTYQSVRRRRGFVFLRFRHSGQQTVLPAELFPGDEYERLVSAVTAAPAAPEVRPIDSAVQYEYTTDKGFVGRLARSSTRHALTRPAMLVILIVLALPGALGLLLIGLSLLLGRDPGPGFGALAFSVVVVGAIVGITRLTTGYVLQRQTPVGSRLGLGLTDTGLVLRLARFSSEIPYGRIRGVKRLREFTVLVMRPGRMMIPSALLPLEAESRLQFEIARKDRP